MSGFVKIYGKILKSSVWVGQPAHLRLTWIALLVLADRKGNVYSSVPGLAQDAGVTIPEVLAALETFQKPDPFSRTPDHEGRRIVEIDGGWRVLNHDKYREMRTESQVKNAERQAKFKAKKRGKAAAEFAPVSAPVSTVTGNDANAPLCTLYSDPTDQPDQSDPDPIPSDPAKDGRARARPLPAGVFDAPVLSGAGKVCDVPEWWAGPTERHRAYAAEFRLDVDDEAARFRVQHFQVGFPATATGIERRFTQWLYDARTRAQTDTHQRQKRELAGADAPARRGRMPTNGVAQLQPDEGRTGFEVLDTPQPEPERPRRAARR